MVPLMCERAGVPRKRREGRFSSGKTKHLQRKAHREKRELAGTLRVSEVAEMLGPAFLENYLSVLVKKRRETT